MIFLKCKMAGKNVIINLDNISNIYERRDGKCQIYYNSGEYDNLENDLKCVIKALKTKMPNIVFIEVEDK